MLDISCRLSGVGFGICLRLLFQLCHTSPSDAQPQSFARQDIDVDPGFQVPPSGCDGLTLIMACRSMKRAEAARTKLLRLLDAYIAKLQRQPGYDGHADAFRKNVVIDTRELDLAVIGSVFRFSTGMSQTYFFSLFFFLLLVLTSCPVLRYPYVSHLICNAGVVSAKGIDWVGAWIQVFTDFIGAFTAPTFIKQHVGELSVDGLGWVWQCNLFGHYALVRSPPSLAQ